MPPLTLGTKIQGREICKSAFTYAILVMLDIATSKLWECGIVGLGPGILKVALNDLSLGSQRHLCVVEMALI